MTPPLDNPVTAPEIADAKLRAIAQAADSVRLASRMGARARAMRGIRRAGVLALALAAGACASSPGLTCRPRERSAVMESMYFGTARPGGVVSADEWTQFVNQVATPRFPTGLTSWPASGQWRGASGVIEREASYVLHVLHPDTEADERAVGEILREYRARFQQEAVLRVRSTACVSF